MDLTIAPLHLTYPYFGAGPGMGGVSELFIRAAAHKIQVVFCGDRTDRSERPRLLLTQTATEDWRQILVAIEREGAFAFYTEGETEADYVWPHQTTFEGVANYVTELIACAWCCPPVGTIAQSLREASDGQLAELREKVGSLRKVQFIKQALKVQSVGDEHGMSFGSMIRRLNGRPIDFAAMRSDAKAFARVVELESRARQARRDWEVLPFKDAIEHMMTSWRTLHPGTSMTTQMSVGMRGATLRKYIEQYVQENHALPTGTHRVTSTSFSSRSDSSRNDFSIDLDTLR